MSVPFPPGFPSLPPPPVPLVSTSLPPGFHPLHAPLPTGDCPHSSPFPLHSSWFPPPPSPLPHSTPISPGCHPFLLVTTPLTPFHFFWFPTPLPPSCCPSLFSFPFLPVSTFIPPAFYPSSQFSPLPLGFHSLFSLVPRLLPITCRQQC